jgi:hypothetical protein
MATLVSHDPRVAETAEQSRTRLIRVIGADIAWWRDNAAAIHDLEAKTIALEIAVELERVQEHMRRRWHRGQSRQRFQDR